MKSVLYKMFVIILLIIFLININSLVIYAIEDEEQQDNSRLINDIEYDNIISDEENEENEETEETEEISLDNTDILNDDIDKETEITEEIENEEIEEIEETEETEEPEEFEKLENEDVIEQSINYENEQNELIEIENHELLEKIQTVKTLVTDKKANIEESIPSVKYNTHIQDVGWQDWKENGQMSGTEGRSLRLEGIHIKLYNMPNVKLQYQVHVQDIGWQDWKENGQMSGTEGKSLRLEGIRIFLQDTDEYSIAYRVHVQDIGWQEWKYDGDMAGTVGRSLRLEAINIKLVPKVKKSKLYIDTPTNGKTYYSPSTINVKGWKLANVQNTYIKAYLNGKEIDSNNINYYDRPEVTASTILYGTRTQNMQAGFSFNIDVSDIEEGNYTINIDLYKDDVKLNHIDTKITIYTKLHVLYRSHVQDIGWQGYQLDGATSGTEGKSLRVEAMNINLINAPSGAKILYRTHVQDIGWQNWNSNNQMAGTVGLSRRIEAIQIKLENMPEYTVEYRTHVQNIGWTDWAIDGETSGTEGKSWRVEAIQIRIVDHYSRQNKGIDVSEFNGDINWSKVKKSGISFAMIRLGYRGYRNPRLVLDEKALYNLKNAKAQGIKIGVYFVTQAINADEAREEAIWCVNTLNANNIKIDYPIAIDTELSTAEVDKGFDPGRADVIDRETRTTVCKTFCDTIKSQGQKAMIYASTYWFEFQLNLDKLKSYDLWLANYTLPQLSTSFVIWQFTSTGSISGISGNVDINIGYKNY